VEWARFASSPAILQGTTTLPPPSFLPSSLLLYSLDSLPLFLVNPSSPPSINNIDGVNDDRHRYSFSSTHHWRRTFRLLIISLTSLFVARDGDLFLPLGEDTHDRDSWHLPTIIPTTQHSMTRRQKQMNTIHQLNQVTL
jgi:hypothetical protein